MLADFLLPSPSDLWLYRGSLEEGVITVVVTPRQKAACCPDCHSLAERVHSRYVRTIADLPGAGHPVRLRLCVRRFFCPNTHCDRLTFAECLPEVAARRARRTQRLAEAQRMIGLDLGGQAGARQAGRQGMPTSPDTLLRLVHHCPANPVAAPRVLGIDDRAWKKGHTYGTILVDRESRQVIDLLPDRKAETVTAWLKERPGIEIISRDRAGTYADAARAGTPQAVQVADRWHLLANLRQALERLLHRERGWVQANRQTEATVQAPSMQEPLAVEPDPAIASSDQPMRRAERLQHGRREKRKARYAQVITLRAGGMNLSAIARQTGLDRRTIRHYLSVGQFPEIAPRSSRLGVLSPFLPHLLKRWEGGCHNGAQLLREIREQGYRHSRGTLSDWVARQRQRTPEAAAASSQPLSPRLASWLLVRRADELSEDERSAARQDGRGLSCRSCRPETGRQLHCDAA